MIFNNKVLINDNLFLRYFEHDCFKLMNELIIIIEFLKMNIIYNNDSFSVLVHLNKQLILNNK